MTNEQIRALALIAAAQARIAGMQAKNLERDRDGCSLAYDEQAFFEEANTLEQLAIHVINT